MDFTWKFGSSAADHRSTNQPIIQSTDQSINRSVKAIVTGEIPGDHSRKSFLGTSPISQPTISSPSPYPRSLPLIVKALPTTLYCSLCPLPFTFTLRCLIHNCTKNMSSREHLSRMFCFIFMILSKCLSKVQN